MRESRLRGLRKEGGEVVISCEPRLFPIQEKEILFLVLRRRGIAADTEPIGSLQYFSPYITW